MRAHQDDSRIGALTSSTVRGGNSSNFTSTPALTDEERQKARAAQAAAVLPNAISSGKVACEMSDSKSNGTTSVSTGFSANADQGFVKVA